MALKVEGPRSPGGVAGIGGVTARPAVRPADAASTASRTFDTASIMGMSETELTPRVRDAVMTLMREVEALRQDLNRARQRVSELERLADQDALLPLMNRRAFLREMSRAVAYSARYGDVSTLVYFDLNGLKQINDVHGHAAGDAELRFVGENLLQLVRETDVVARLGGDEFGVILAHTDVKQGEVKAALLANGIRNRAFRWEGQSFFLELAYGIFGLQLGQNPDEALAAADRAMYAHKSVLKGGVAAR